MMAIDVKLDEIKVESEEVSTEDLTKNKKSSLDDVKALYEKSDVRKETKEEVADFEIKLSKYRNLDDKKKAKKYKKFLHGFFDSKEDIVQTVDKTGQSGVKVEVGGETFEAHVEGEKIAEKFIDYKIDKIAEEININETVRDELTIEKGKITESNTQNTSDGSSDTPLDQEEGSWFLPKMINKGKKIRKEFWNDLNTDKLLEKGSNLFKTGAEKLSGLVGAFRGSLIAKASSAFSGVKDTFLGLLGK